MRHQDDRGEGVCIMASIAEFYSQNLANEVRKGTMQKVKGGARRRWRRSAISTSAR